MSRREGAPLGVDLLGSRRGGRAHHLLLRWEEQSRGHREAPRPAGHGAGSPKSRCGVGVRQREGTPGGGALASAPRSLSSDSWPRPRATGRQAPSTVRKVPLGCRLPECLQAHGWGDTLPHCTCEEADPSGREARLHPTRQGCGQKRTDGQKHECVCRHSSAIPLPLPFVSALPCSGVTHQLTDLYSHPQ